MHFLFGVNAEGRVSIKEAGDGSPEQRWAIVGFLEQDNRGDTLLWYLDHVRRFDEVKDEDGEWGASGNFMGVSVNADEVHVENLFDEEQVVAMSHEEFIELVEAYSQALEDAVDPRRASRKR
jgi:uncharacterized protein YacL (UPF0231 family)